MSTRGINPTGEQYDPYLDGQSAVMKNDKRWHRELEKRLAKLKERFQLDDWEVDLERRALIVRRVDGGIRHGMA